MVVQSTTNGFNILQLVYHERFSINTSRGGCGLLSKREKSTLVGKDGNQHKDAGNEEPDGGDRQAHRCVAKDGSREEALYQLPHVLGDLGKGVAHETDLLRTQYA